MEEQAAGVNSLRSVQQLLWHSISASLRPVEQEEVKRALGRSTIDENEGLFTEADALADILCMLQKDTAVLLSRKQLCSNPERSMVESEIMMALDKLRVCASTVLFCNSAVKDPAAVIPTSDAQDKAVFDYVVSSSKMQSPLASNGGPQSASGILRPGTGASSRPLTASTVSSSVGPASTAGAGAGMARPYSRPSTASSGTSGSTTTLTDPQQLVKCLQSKLNVFAIDEVKDALRSALKEERAALLDDIAYLTALLSDETDLQDKAAVPPPPLHQLRHYSNKLQRLVAVEEGRLQQELVVSHMFAAAHAEPNKAGRLRRMVSVAREQPAAQLLPAVKYSHEGAMKSPAMQQRPSSATRSNQRTTAGEQETKAGTGCHADILIVHSMPSLVSAGRKNALDRRRSSDGGGADPHTGHCSSWSALGRGTASSHKVSLQCGAEQQQQHCPMGVVDTLSSNSDRDSSNQHGLPLVDDLQGATSGSTQALGQLHPWQQMPSQPCSSKRLPGSLLDAQAASLRGGVAAILAKHNCSLTLPSTTCTQKG